MLPDGENVAMEGFLDEAGNACVVLTPACYAVPGNIVLSIYTISAEETLCIYSCSGIVISTMGRKGNAEEPDKPIIEAYTDPAIAEIRQQIADLAAQAAALQAAVAAIPAKQGSGANAVTFGLDTAANGTQSAAFGKGTVANKRSSVVFGEYNVEDTSNPVTKNGYVMIVGNGSASKRSNALTLSWDGTMTIGGALIIGKGLPWEAQLTPQKLQKLLALLE